MAFFGLSGWARAVRDTVSLSCGKLTGWPGRVRSGGAGACGESPAVRLVHFPGSCAKTGAIRESLEPVMSPIELAVARHALRAYLLPLRQAKDTELERRRLDGARTDALATFQAWCANGQGG